MNSIAWYARDGHRDLFPQLHRYLSGLGKLHAATFICHNDEEVDLLRDVYAIDRPVVVARELSDLKRRPVPSAADLDRLSAVYDFPLSQCLWAEQFELGLDRQLVVRNLVAHLEFWERTLAVGKVDALISERPSLLSTCAAWLVCRRHRIRYLDFIDVPPMPGRMAVSGSWEGHYDGLEAAVRDGGADGFHRAHAADHIARMRTVPQKTSEAQRRIAVDSHPPHDILETLPTRVRNIRRRAAYYPYPSLAARVGDFVLPLVRRRSYRSQGLFSAPSELPDERHFLFPLHSAREWSNYTWMGPDYGDQPSLIARVARCLPPSTTLWVKEHTAGFGERPASYYRALRHIPGVRLITPWTNSFDLIHGAEGIVTLGSTMGFEAAVFGKPVVLLGTPWYHGMPGVSRARSWDTLAPLLHDARRSHETASDNALIDYIAAVWAVTFSAVKWPHPETLMPTNVQALAQVLAAKLPFPGAPVPLERSYATT